MARIPNEELERLRREVSVERLIEAAGIELKAAGKDLLGRCPFHEDREASLVVTPSKNLWHCFACQIGGGPIDWMMKSKGVSFRHAVELLREGALELPVGAVKGGRIRVLPAPVSFDADDRALLAQAIDYYHERLKQSPEALAYLARRGLTHPEMIEHFRLGFADRTLGLRLPEKTRKAGAEIRGRLQKLGLWRESGHEHFNGSIVIPVITPEGEITEVYGRKIHDNLREGTPKHLYLPGPHCGVWNKAALAACKEIILCESLIDALTFWCAGYRNVTAAYGVEGFATDHLAAFKRYGTERVLIAYDRNEAGDRAAERLSKQLMSEGLDCYRIQFPHGMDTNEYALKVTPAMKSLGLVIRKAQWLGKGEAKPLSTTAPMAITAPMPACAALESSPALIPAATVLEVMSSDASPQLAWTPDATLAPPAAAAVLPAPDAALSLEAALPCAAPVLCAALPATPVPPLPAAEIEAQVNGEDIMLVLGDRRYRVRGLKKNLAFDVLLKVNVLVARSDAFHVDTLDLYSVRARTAFITQAAAELKVTEEMIRHDLGVVLRQLEALQERLIAQTLDPEMRAPMALTDEHEALAFLKDPRLLDRLLADFERCGVVGERTNKLLAYLAATSRKLEAPLAVMVQSSSAAGKSSLMEAVLAFMPEEDTVQYSA
ncbi:MAG: CHC2 zinc finger domain-containing protein, partial [Steroidobacteraceae bacterium]